MQSSMESQQAAMHNTSAGSRSVMHDHCHFEFLPLLLINLSHCKHCTLVDAHNEGSCHVCIVVNATDIKSLTDNANWSCSTALVLCRGGND